MINVSQQSIENSKFNSISGGVNASPFIKNENIDIEYHPTGVRPIFHVVGKPNNVNQLHITQNGSTIQSFNEFELDGYRTGYRPIEYKMSQSTINYKLVIVYNNGFSENIQEVDIKPMISTDIHLSYIVDEETIGLKQIWLGDYKVTDGNIIFEVYKKLQSESTYTMVGTTDLLYVDYTSSFGNTYNYYVKIQNTTLQSDTITVSI